MNKTGVISVRCLSRDRRWVILLALETACVVGFGLLYGFGHETAAWVLALLPVQLVVAAVLLHDDFWMLGYLAGLVPLTALELLPFSLLHASFAGVLALWLLVRAMRRSPHERRLEIGRVRFEDGRMVSALAVLIILSNAVAYLRGWYSTPLLRDTLIGLEVLLIIWVSAVTPRSMNQVRLLLKVMAFGYVLTCLMLPFIAVDSQGGAAGKTLVGPGGLVNMNAYAAQIGGFLVLLAGVSIDRDTKARLPVWLAMLVMAAALVFTRSRGAWLGFGFAFLYVVLRSRSLRMVAAAGAMVLALALTEFVSVMVSSRLEATGMRDPSFLWRLQLWAAALEVAKDNWLLGVGFQNFRFIKYSYGFGWPKRLTLPFNSHNLLLEMLANLGVAGLLIFVGLLVRAARRADRLARATQGQGRGIGVGLCAALIMYLVHGMFDCILWHHGAFLLLGIIVGLTSSVERLSLNEGLALSSSEETAATQVRTQSHWRVA